jgi:hypothetical protein
MRLRLPSPVLRLPSPRRRARHVSAGAVALLAGLGLPSVAHARDGESLEEMKGMADKAPDLLQPPPPARGAGAGEGEPGEKAKSGEKREPSKTDGPWDFGVYGFLRAGYDWTHADDRYTFIGQNNGFVLDSARIGAQGRNRDYKVVFRVAVEGASDVLSSPNTPLGSLSVRLRDALARWDPTPWVGVQVGQFKAPFQEEELRGAQDLMFASRAVGVEGVLPGRGFQANGIQLDRQLGVMLSPVKPIGREDGFKAAYYVMLMNGNGSNQLLDDNGRVGLVGRGEVEYGKLVRFGAALFRNDRRVGEPPNLYNEEDLGLTADLDVKVAGLEVFGAATRLRTVFPTVGTAARVQLAFHAQAAYRFDLGPVFVAPAYRYAYFHPWQEGGNAGFDQQKLQYHTIGARIGGTKLPIQGWVNYTFTGEPSGRSLSNDRLELLGQLTF